MSWTSAHDAVGVTGYSVYLDGVQTATLPASSTSSTVTGLTWGSHQVLVLAFDGASNLSAPGTLTATSAWR